MIQNIKDYLKTKAIEGDIILYRDKAHKKKAMCEFLAQRIKTDKTICVHSGGAFGLYIAKAFQNNQIIICGNPTAEYRQQIEKMPNAVVEGKVSTTAKVKTHAEALGFYFVDQFGEPLIKQYYKHHFANILKEVGSVDAFCDCGHSCATIAGAIESGANLEFILGIVKADGEREHVHYLAEYKDKFVQETTRNFNTKQIQTEIEEMYPDFGNIFEATRSISAAMSWLLKNPNKTVLVYVGDSPVYGEDATI